MKFDCSAEFTAGSIVLERRGRRGPHSCQVTYYNISSPCAPLGEADSRPSFASFSSHPRSEAPCLRVYVSVLTRATLSWARGNRARTQRRSHTVDRRAAVSRRCTRRPWNRGRGTSNIVNSRVFELRGGEPNHPNIFACANSARTVATKVSSIRIFGGGGLLRE